MEALPRDDGALAQSAANEPLTRGQRLLAWSVGALLGTSLAAAILAMLAMATHHI